MRTSTRWTVAVVVVVVALAAALWTQLGGDDSQPGSIGTGAPRERRDADTAEALAGPRARAELAPCPPPVEGDGPEVPPGVRPWPQLDFVLECVGDGSSVDVAKAVAGRTVVLNLWAYWCAPCARELPAMAEYQRREGSAVTVLTVHQDENETAALLRLAELGVHLPTLQDGGRRIAAALKVPNVMPATVLLRPDGSVAAILPAAFTDADQIAAAVEQQIGS
jgi:thiol-disulfide isomerase/thioredoxin